jgi:hypothetical protein
VTKESSALARQFLLIICKMLEEVNPFPLPLSVISHFVPGKMIPISRVVNASLVSSASDPPLSSDSILIKWRPVTAAAGIGSWDNGGGNHTIIMTPGGGGVLVSWLVSLLSEEIKGFILQGLSVFSLLHLLSFLPSLTQSSSDPVSSTSRIHFIQYSSSDPGSGISVSISPDHITLSSRAIREYVAGVSNQRLYVLNSGLLRW